MGGFLRRRWGRHLGSRGASEAGVAVVVASLVAGGLVGTGLTDTLVETSDGLTWLPDDERGEAVQVNPATGGPQVRLRVAGAGNQLEVAQRDGLLVVTDTVTGEVTIIDVATLTASGSLAGSGDSAVEVLLDDAQLYVVDRLLGTVRRIDPASAAEVGTGWSAAAPLADAALDRRGTVWALRVDGLLYALEWSGAGKELREVAPARPVAGAGPGSVLVPHDRGVTVFAPEGEVVVRVDTGQDQTWRADQLGQPLRPAPASPVDLVPVSVAESATVLVVAGDDLVEVDTGRLGCGRPGTPVVYRHLIYVPCLGAGRVIVLTPDGRRRPPDIRVGRGDPDLVLDDGRLIVYSPASGVGVMVEPDGTTRRIRTRDGSVPVQDPDRPRPPAEVPAPPPPPERAPNVPPGRDQGQPPPVEPGGEPERGGGGRDSPRPPADQPGEPPAPAPSREPSSSSPPPPSPPPSPDPVPPNEPTGVTATPQPDGSVRVQWSSQGPVERFRVLRAGGSSGLATTTGTWALVTTLPIGQPVRLVVEATNDGLVAVSQPSNEVTPYAPPGAPTGLSISVTRDGSSAAQLTASWAPGAANGSPITQYRFRISTSSHGSWGGTTSGTSTGRNLQCSHTPTTVCGGITVTLEVWATNAAGEGPSATTTRAYIPPPQITSMSCEYTASNPRRALCTVTYTGSNVTIDWSHNQLDGRSSGLVSCSATTPTRVDVTISNAGGSDSAWDTVSCSGQVP
jgi:hypothetical protein